MLAHFTDTMRGRSFFCALLLCSLFLVSCSASAQPSPPIIGAGHVWPGPINGCSANQLIWSFFKEHPLP